MPTVPENPTTDSSDYHTPRVSPAAPPTTLDDNGTALAASMSSQVVPGSAGNIPHDVGGPNRSSVPFLKGVKELVAAIPPPQTPNDIFRYQFAVRRTLRDTSYTSWLLAPPETLTEAQRILSSTCATIILTPVESGFFGVDTWPDDTYNLLKFFQELVSPIYDVESQPPCLNLEFPTRRPSEYMSEYTERVELWVELYMPTVDQYVPHVQLIASWMWISHCRIFHDLRQLGAAFASMHSRFTTLQSVLAWFRRCSQLQLPLSPPRNSTKHRKKRSSGKSDSSGVLRSNSNSQGSNSPRLTKNDHANNKQNHNRDSSSFAKDNRYSRDCSKNVVSATKGPKRANKKVSKTEITDSDSSGSSVSQYTTVPQLANPVQENPKSYEEAMSRSDAVKWQRACDAEIGMITKRNVLELVVPPKHAHVLTSRWILETKLSDTGVPLKYKARLAIRGFEQRYDRDYKDTYAEVVSTDILLLILNLAAQRDFYIEQIDVKSALFYGDLNHVLYMRQPDGYEDGTDRVCRLKKSFYGLRQAHRQWFLKLRSILKDFGFYKVSDTLGLFVCSEQQKTVFLVVYVDKILVASPDKNETARVKSLFRNALEITALGYPKSYLSLRIEKTASGLALDARKNVVKILDKHRDLFSKYDFKEVIPILPSDVEKAVRIYKMLHQQLPWDEELEKDATPLSSWETSIYTSAVGGLNSLASKSRPDLAFGASHLSTGVKYPTKLHWNMLMRMLKYLDITKEAKLPFRKQKRPKLYGYCHASFSGDRVRYPHGGYLWFYGDKCLFYWTSKIERHACSSIHEAKFLCLIEALQYGELMRNVLVFLGEMSETSTSVLYTNSPFDMMNNHKLDQVTPKLYLYRDKVVDLMIHSKIKLERFRGEVNPADVLTKPLSEPQFLKAVSHIIQLPEVEIQKRTHVLGYP